MKHHFRPVFRQQLELDTGAAGKFQGQSRLATERQPVVCREIVVYLPSFSAAACDCSRTYFRVQVLDFHDLTVKAQSRRCEQFMSFRMYKDVALMLVPEGAPCLVEVNPTHLFAAPLAPQDNVYVYLQLL